MDEKSKRKIEAVRLARVVEQYIPGDDEGVETQKELGCWQDSKADGYDDAHSHSGYIHDVKLRVL